MAPIDYVFKNYKTKEVDEFTSDTNRQPNALDWAYPNAVKVYCVLCFCAVAAALGPIAHWYHPHFIRLEVTVASLFLMMWWVSYLHGQKLILTFIVGASFCVGLLVGDQRVTTFLHLHHHWAPTYAFACSFMLFLSHLIALSSKSSPAVFFNTTIVTLPIYVYSFVFLELTFSLPTDDISSSPPPVFVKTLLKDHRTLSSFIFCALISFIWGAVLKFFTISSIRFGVLVPIHLHLLSFLVYLSGYHLYYLTTLYIACFLFAFNLRYHAYDTMKPPPPVPSPEVPEGSAMVAHHTDHAVIDLADQQRPPAHSSLVSFFTLFIGRSTYLLFRPVRVILVLLWGTFHVKAEGAWDRITRHWISGKAHSMRVWEASYDLFIRMVEVARSVYLWCHDFLSKAATVSFFLVLFVGIVFALKN